MAEPRARLHANVARAAEARAGDRLDELSGLLAHHWSEAGGAFQAAAWHVRAAHWVCATDLAASRRHWEEARGLLLPLPETAERSASTDTQTERREIKSGDLRGPWPA